MWVILGDVQGYYSLSTQELFLEVCMGHKEEI